jgi:hypothetical protein
VPCAGKRRISSIGSGIPSIGMRACCGTRRRSTAHSRRSEGLSGQPERRRGSASGADANRRSLCSAVCAVPNARSISGHTGDAARSWPMGAASMRPRRQGSALDGATDARRTIASREGAYCTRCPCLHEEVRRCPFAEQERGLQGQRRRSHDVSQGCPCTAEFARQWMRCAVNVWERDKESCVRCGRWVRLEGWLLGLNAARPQARPGSQRRGYSGEH